MKRITLSALFFVLALWAQPLLAQQFFAETGHAEFTSKVPMHTFTGTSEKLVGLINLADNTVDFYIDLTTFDTGIGKRDKDMRKTLETDEFPFAEFFGKLVSTFDPDNADAQPAKVEGDFKIHGVSKPVSIEGTMHMTPDGLQVDAAWVINIKDYEIEPPGLLFMKVDETQDVKISLLLKPKAEG